MRGSTIRSVRSQCDRRNFAPLSSQTLGPIWMPLQIYHYIRPGSRWGTTVCKTVRPMLSDRRLVMYVLQCVSVLSVFDGDPDPPPQFSAHIYCGKMGSKWIKMSLGMEEGLGPGDIVLQGDLPRPLPKWRRAPCPIFGPCPLWPNGLMDQYGTWQR